jgi:hypothetical protein
VSIGGDGVSTATNFSLFDKALFADCCKNDVEDDDAVGSD